MERLKVTLVPGHVYRRADLARLSSNVDRPLQGLVAEGHLKKLVHGIYSAPEQNLFVEAPPEPHSLLKAFLNDPIYQEICQEIYRCDQKV